MPSNEVLFDGEDLSFGSGLYVDLVPRGSWGQNLRAVMEKSEWRRLSSDVARRCGNRCEGCGRVKKRIECHERWSYDHAEGIQALRRLVGLCASCHRATHFGFAQSIGRGAQAFSHLQKANGWAPKVALDHIQEAFETWGIRSKMSWIVDFPLSLCPKLQEKVLSLPDPRSPCVRLCRLEEGFCVGCRRSPEEISKWGALSEPQQRSLTLHLLAGRGYNQS